MSSDKLKSLVEARYRIAVYILVGFWPFFAFATDPSTRDRIILGLASTLSESRVLLTWQPLSRAGRLLSDLQKELKNFEPRPGQPNAKLFASNLPFEASSVVRKIDGNPKILLEIVLPAGSHEIDLTNDWVMSVLRDCGMSTDDVISGDTPVAFNYSRMHDYVAIRAVPGLIVRLFQATRYSDDDLNGLAKTIPPNHATATAMKIQLKSIFEKRGLKVPNSLKKIAETPESTAILGFINRMDCERILQNQSS